MAHRVLVPGAAAAGLHALSVAESAPIEGGRREARYRGVHSVLRVQHLQRAHSHARTLRHISAGLPMSSNAVLPWPCRLHGAEAWL